MFILVLSFPLLVLLFPMLFKDFRGIKHKTERIFSAPRKRHQLTTITALVLTGIIAGMRWESGGDWTPYFDFYTSSIQSIMGWYFKEPGIKVLAVAAKLIDLPYTAFLIVQGLFFCSAIYLLALKTYSPRISVLVILANLVAMLFGTQRQLLSTACGIMAFAAMMPPQPRRIAALILGLLALLFHLSGVGFLLVVLTWTAYEHWHGLRYKWSTIIIFSISLVFLTSVTVGMIDHELIIKAIQKFGFDSSYTGQGGLKETESPLKTGLLFLDAFILFYASTYCLRCSTSKNERFRGLVGVLFSLLYIGFYFKFRVAVGRGLIPMRIIACINLSQMAARLSANKHSQIDQMQGCAVGTYLVARLFTTIVSNPLINGVVFY